MPPLRRPAPSVPIRRPSKQAASYSSPARSRSIPATGAFVPGGVEEQAEQSLRNLKAVLAGAGCTLGDVVKTTVFLTDMGAFAAVNAVYAKYFEGDCPARSAVQVGALPKGALVEIEAIAVKK